MNNSLFTAINCDIKKCSIWESLPSVDTQGENFLNLLKNIAKHGQTSPVAVFKNGDSYKIINGRKRYEIAKRLGHTEIPIVIISDSPAQNESFFNALHENRLRQNKIDYRYESQLLNSILASGAFDSAKDLADRLEIKKSTLSKVLAFNSLPDGLGELFNGWENVSLRFGYKLTTLLSSEEMVTAFNTTLSEIDPDDSITDKQTMLLASVGEKPMVCTRPFKNKIGSVLATENTKKQSLTLFDTELVRGLKRLLKNDCGIEKLKQLLLVGQGEVQ